MDVYDPRRRFGDADGGERDRVLPDWGGYVNAVTANTGALVWQLKVSDLPGATFGARARTSPAVYGNEVIFGDNYGFPQAGGAHIYAVNAQTGNLIWSEQVDSNPAAIITANPVVADNKLIVGVSSDEEAAALFADLGFPSYQCCTFRGKVLALDPVTGAQLWATYTIPWNMGPTPSTNLDSNSLCTTTSYTSGVSPSGCDYSGGAVWDTPAVDVAAGRVFLGAGNNYTAPGRPGRMCAGGAGEQHIGCQLRVTRRPLRLHTRARPQHRQRRLVRIRRKGWDAWTVSCAFLPPGTTWCPSPSSPDFDFGGSGPNLITVNGPNGTKRKLVGIGQKSGVYWAFDETTGAVAWNTLVGPGAALGGIEWGTAYDGQRIYVPLANSYHTLYTLAGGQSAKPGSWAALDPATGKFDWQVPTPDGTALAIGAASAGQRRRVRRRLGRLGQQQHVRSRRVAREDPLELPRKRLDLVGTRNRQRRLTGAPATAPLAPRAERQQHVLRISPEGDLTRRLSPPAEAGGDNPFVAPRDTRVARFGRLR